MFRRLFRHIKEGFIGVKRHFGMAFSSASAVTITLILIGFFLMLSVNMNVLANDIESNISLVALIDYDTSASQIENIKNQVQQVNGVKNVEYRTKDEEFDFYNETYPDMAEFSELYRDSNPFHDAFMIYLSNTNELENVKSTVAKINGITSVEDGGSETYVLVDILEGVRLFGGILVLALCVLAVYLIYNTIKITISSRVDEIWIMRNVGAKNGYIRAPFLVEGIIIGFLGSIIPIGLMIGSYLYVYKKTGGLLAGIFNLVPPYPFLLYLSLVILGIGVIVGFIGSYISVTKYLRFKR